MLPPPCRMRRLSMTLGSALLPATLLAQTPSPAPAAQNPSPMVEHSRAHERVEPREVAGVRRSFNGPLGKPVEVFIPSSTKRADALHLVVSFLGAAFIPSQAVAALG